MVITLHPLFVYTACKDILGNGIIISHFGVYSAHLLCIGNNSCCLCLAFTVRFIYKHQLPMVLEDSNESSAKFNSAKLNFQIACEFVKSHTLPFSYHLLTKIIIHFYYIIKLFDKIFPSNRVPNWSKKYYQFLLTLTRHY